MISTHQLSELATVVDHIVAIDKGRIVTNSAAAAVCSAADNADLESAIQRLLSPGTTKESV